MEHSVFAIELCLLMEPGNFLRGQLRELIASHPSASTPGKKWELLRLTAQMLVESQALFVKGCWDFFDDDTKARGDYEMWTKGMTTEEGARKSASGAPGEGDGSARYMTFTISLLLENGSPTEREIARLCDIPQDRLWRRETFMRLLRGLTRVNYAAVRSDVLYVIPGNEAWGLTAEDLAAEKFAYLRDLA